MCPSGSRKYTAAAGIHPMTLGSSAGSPKNDNGWTPRSLWFTGPLADGWILTGSILATYGMARGWVEFWLVWIAVDAVGVPLLLVAGYYPSAIMYIVYGGFCVVGFVAWLRIERRERTEALAEDVASPVAETVG